MQTVDLIDIGKIKYVDAWKLQEKYFNGIVDIKIQNRRLPKDEQIVQKHCMIYCEHEPVITLGKNASDENVLMNEVFLATHAIEKFHINRGGDVTFHGPGQIVCYPILDLDYFFTDIGKYLRSLEEVVIRTLLEFGIKGERMPGVTGVWIEPHLKHKARKICAIGIRCSRWVTMHGFAFNINTNMDYFNYIIPCGLNDKKVTSLKQETGTEHLLEIIKEKLNKHFQDVFQCKFEKVQPSILL